MIIFICYLLKYLGAPTELIILAGIGAFIELYGSKTIKIHKE